MNELYIYQLLKTINDIEMAVSQRFLMDIIVPIWSPPPLMAFKVDIQVKAFIQHWTSVVQSKLKFMAVNACLMVFGTPFVCGLDWQFDPSNGCYGMFVDL